VTAAARERLRTTLPLLLVCATAWTLVAVRDAPTSFGTIHLESMPISMSSMVALPSMQVGGLSAFASQWLVMVAAMMGLALIAPIQYVRARSFAERRFRSILLFSLSYSIVWLLAGVLLSALMFVLHEVWSSPWIEASILVALALVWQCTPAKQRCLNRCHEQPPLDAFGARADVAVALFGARHGSWCVSSCWLLMLVPMVIPYGGIVAMAVVSLWLFSERLERPKQPAWELRLPSKSLRILIAQTSTLFGRCLGWVSLSSAATVDR